MDALFMKATCLCIESESIMQIITRQRCLRAANYRYSWRSSIFMIVLSLAMLCAIAHELGCAIDSEAADVNP